MGVALSLRIQLGHPQRDIGHTFGVRASLPDLFGLSEFGPCKTDVPIRYGTVCLQKVQVCKFSAARKTQLLLSLLPVYLGLRIAHSIGHPVDPCSRERIVGIY